MAETNHWSRESRNLYQRKFLHRYVPVNKQQIKGWVISSWGKTKRCFTLGMPSSRQHAKQYPAGSCHSERKVNTCGSNFHIASKDVIFTSTNSAINLPTKIGEWVDPNDPRKKTASTIFTRPSRNLFLQQTPPLITCQHKMEEIPRATILQNGAPKGRETFREKLKKCPLTIPLSPKCRNCLSLPRQPLILTSLSFLLYK